MPYNGNTMYGRALMDAVHQVVPAFGRIFIVVSTSDAGEERYDRLREVFSPAEGQVRVFTSLADAYDATTSGNNDVILLDGDSTHTLTEMLTVSKSRVNFVGMDAGFGIRKYGQGAKISLGVTTAATDIAAILNTGVRNTFHNIKVISNNTVTESLYGFVDGGEYTVLNNVEVYKSTDLDVTGAAELVCNADSPMYVNCTFGSLADARSGAVIRPTVLFTADIAGSGKVARDVTFKECNFWIQSTNTANRFVYGANATDIERMCVFEDCVFAANGASSAVPAQNIAFGSSLTVGSVLVRNCSAVNAGTAMSTTTGVFVDGPVPAAATTGLAVQAS